MLCAVRDRKACRSNHSATLGSARNNLTGRVFDDIQMVGHFSAVD